MIFSSAMASNAGGRASNQDAMRMAESGACRCWVIADGLGGHSDGATAANLACDAFIAGFIHFAECSPEAMLTYIGMANRAIRDAQQAADAAIRSASPPMTGLPPAMASTIAALVATDEAFVSGHCGDSRLYHMHEGAIRFQTRDHSMVQAMVDAGDLPPRKMATHPDRNRLLRCLGEQDLPQAETTACSIALASGDAFLLVTDGFWEHVTAREMEAEFAKAATPDAWLNGMAIRLRRRVFATKHSDADPSPVHDNYSAIAVHAVAEGSRQ